jgi:hypothetical protein
MFAILHALGVFFADMFKLRTRADRDLRPASPQK